MPATIESQAIVKQSKEIDGRPLFGIEEVAAVVETDGIAPTGIQTGAKLPSVDVVHSGDTEPDRAVANIHLTETVADEEFVLLPGTPVVLCEVLSMIEIRSRKR